MTDKEILYETLGELLYAVAIADGVVQDSEIDRLKEIVEHHPWGKEIQWSFNYESKKGKTFEEVYAKAIDSCHAFGPTPVYDEFIELITMVADASEGIDKHEELVISNFSKHLVERFKADLDAGLNRYKSE